MAVRLGLFASVSGQLEFGGRYGVGRAWSSGARFLSRFNVIFPLRTDMILLSSSYVFLLWASYSSVKTVLCYGQLFYKKLGRSSLWFLWT